MCVCSVDPLCPLVSWGQNALCPVLSWATLHCVLWCVAHCPLSYLQFSAGIPHPWNLAKYPTATLSSNSNKGQNVLQRRFELYMGAILKRCGGSQNVPSKTGLCLWSKN